MAELQSPGVSVRVIDESITVPASGGTVPLIVTATRRNKINPAGDIAASTTEEAGGDLSLLTSRSDLLTMFGRPVFRESGGTMLHGNETNEYGLHAAWQALGISNTAYVLNADIDLDQLEETAQEPTRAPESGTHWFDISSTDFGLFRYNDDTSAWEEKEVTILNDEPGTGDVQPIANGIANPRSTFGSNGDFAVVTSLTPMVMYEKVAGTWIMLGAETYSKDFQMAPHTSIPSQRSDSSALQDGDVFVKTTPPNNGMDIDMSSYNADSGQFVTKETPVFVINDAATNYYRNLGELDEGVLFVKGDHEGQLNPDYDVNIGRPKYSDGVAVFTTKRWNGNQTTEAVSASDVQEIDLNTYPTSEVIINGVTITLDASVSSDGNVITAGDIANALQSNSSLLALDIRTELVNDTKLRLIKKDALDITVKNVGEANTDWTPNSMTDVAAVLGFGYSVSSGQQLFRKSNWEVLDYEASENEPTREPNEGTLWFSQDLRVELLESYFDQNDNEMKWQTHSWSEDDGSNGLSNSLMIRGSEPDAPASGDVWIDSTDIDNYPVIRQYRNGSWVQLDNTDQTTINGVIFSNYSYEAPFDENGNARPQSSVNEDLAPNPDLYPEGILMFNMDYSTNNVKEYQGDGDWLSVSGNRPDGSPYMGRKAQRQMIVRAMKEAVINSKAIRANDRFFNLITATGYPELLPELNALNVQRKRTAFVVGSSPMRLTDSGNEIQDWATNANGALQDGEEGLITMDNMSAVWALAGLQTDSEGNLVTVPSDSMALQVLLQNDRQAYPWFAPAGDRRGLVPNTTSIGYVTGNYQFEKAEYDDGLTDVMYTNNINPILDDQGIKAFGQKTLTDVPSAMDRINVARLVAYIRYMLPRITRPFLFQPNDAQTRQSAVAVVERFLADIAEKRGIQDFVVVADSSNNTPTRIDRNELWIDVALSPQIAIEFIYIPVRLQNTGGV